MKKTAFLLFIIFLLLSGTLFAQSSYSISPDKAASHMGEKKLVTGHYFKTEVRKAKKRNTWLVLTYMSGTDHSKPAFVDVMTVKVRKSDSIVRSVDTKMTMNLNRVIRESQTSSADLHRSDVAAEGKIVLFEGLPAVMTTFEDIVIAEPVS